MRNALLSVALVAGAFTVTTAAAQTTPAATPTPDASMMPAHAGKHHGSPMMAADTNHDGMITKAEMLAAADARAARMSANGAGADAGSGKKAQTPEAMHARAAAMFDRMDTNHDGKLDSTEIAARQGMMKKAGGKHAGGTDTAAADSGE